MMKNPDTGDAAKSPKLATAGSVNPVHVTQVSSVEQAYRI